MDMTEADRAGTTKGAAMPVEIKSRFTNEVLFSGEYASLKDAVVAAVKAGANLRGAYLRGADLGGVDLGSADLGSVDLGSANLGGANLRGANLRGANLRGADLSSADLGGAYLGSANLRGANLRGADLSSAYLGSANLGGADLDDTKIKGTNAIIQIGPIGSRADMMLVFNTDDGLRVSTGCFYGSADDFLARVMETHGTNQHATNYRNALELAASMLK